MYGLFNQANNITTGYWSSLLIFSSLTAVSIRRLTLMNWDNFQAQLTTIQLVTLFRW